MPIYAPWRARKTRGVVESRSDILVLRSEGGRGMNFQKHPTRTYTTGAGLAPPNTQLVLSIDKTSVSWACTEYSVLICWADAIGQLPLNDLGSACGKARNPLYRSLFRVHAFVGTTVRRTLRAARANRAKSKPRNGIGEVGMERRLGGIKESRFHKTAGRCGHGSFFLKLSCGNQLFEGRCQLLVVVTPLLQYISTCD